MSLRTEFDFTLSHGFVDASGAIHTDGVMRLASPIDELVSMKDPRVPGNPACLTIILFSRVIVRLGTLPLVDTAVVEQLHPDDMAFLERLYERINGFEDGYSHDGCGCGYCACGH